MRQPEFPGSPITQEQRALVETLARTIEPFQAHWISGYFAGLGTGLLRADGASPPQPQAEAAPSQRRLSILYGTETGNSAGVARALATAATDKGLRPTLTDMADYKTRQLGQEQDVVIVVSTYGDGDPPQPATGFFEFVEGRKAPRLGGMRFAVLALGDSSYERFCEAGKRLDRRFEELGAARLAPRRDCDVDFEEAADAWRADVLDLLHGADAEPVPAGNPARTAFATQAPVYDRRTPFSAVVIENQPIVGRGSTKETRHVEISLAGSGLRYEPGDALGVVVRNAGSTVDALLSALRLGGDAPVEIKGSVHSLRDAFESHLEITTATPRFLDHWASITGARPLAQLLQDDHAGERAVFLRTHHVVDIARKFPAPGLEAQRLLPGLRPLQPRLYSIASSQAVVGDEVHLTVAPVRYTLHGEPRHGVATGQIADRSPPDERLPVYVQGNPHFRRPADDVPIVMIGAGTGIAPYRAFMQEREARGARGRSWLFFGDRNFRTDFLYQTEWQALLKQGVLTRMDVAFSRDGASKTYVQHRMWDAAGDLFAWLEDGAHVYVCGDAKNLAPDVHTMLVDIIARESRASREAAEDYMHSLQANHRYQRDVY
ncbi:MAG: assimilatory sulfite reductase (NADPH) flavoprotein subunit [Sphingomonadales bacterium]